MSQDSSDEVVAPMSPAQDPLQYTAYAMLHSMRTLGFLPWFALALKLYPKNVVMALVAYYSLRWTKTWQNAMHRFLRYASCKEPRLISAQKVPFDSKKQYILTVHPHGILAYGWFNIVCRAYDDELGSNLSKGAPFVDNLRTAICAAPLARHFPGFEIAQGLFKDANADTIHKILSETGTTVVLSPGGFSEAVYTGYRKDQEVAYLLGRTGFIQLAIENGVDIIPSYTFGLGAMYRVWDWKRQERAELAQTLGIPMVAWAGKYGTNIPFTEDICVVTFDPFPTSKYTLDQVEQAHADYLVYLKQCFEAYKHTTAATKNMELVFAGRGQLPARL